MRRQAAHRDDSFPVRLEHRFPSQWPRHKQTRRRHEHREGMLPGCASAGPSTPRSPLSSPKQQWSHRRQRKRLQDTIPAGWGVNGALERTTVDQPSRKSESARARERARQERRVKDSQRQKEKKTERDRETNSEGRTPLDHVGVSLVSSRTLLFMRPSACARARARERERKIR